MFDKPTKAKESGENFFKNQISSIPLFVWSRRFRRFPDVPVPPAGLVFTAKLFSPVGLSENDPFSQQPQRNRCHNIHGRVLLDEHSRKTDQDYRHNDNPFHSLEIPFFFSQTEAIPNEYATCSDGQTPVLVSKV